MRVHDDLHALSAFHRFEGLVDLVQRVVVRNDRLGADHAGFEQLDGHLVVAWNAAVRAGHETLFVVDCV